MIRTGYMLAALVAAALLTHAPPLDAHEFNNIIQAPADHDYAIAIAIAPDFGIEMLEPSALADDFRTGAGQREAIAALNDAHSAAADLLLARPEVRAGVGRPAVRHIANS